MASDKKARFQKLQERARDLAVDLELLKDEMQESFDNLPENLQYGERARMMEDRIDCTDSFITELDAIVEWDWDNPA